MSLPPPPRYGTVSLAEVAPSLLTALGWPIRPPRQANPAGRRPPPGEGPAGPGLAAGDVLGLGPARKVCLVLLDGLGAHLLDAHRTAAPFLDAHRRGDLDAAFPTTTVTSLATLTTGRPAGEHGMVGPTVRITGSDRPANLLTWRLSGVGPTVELEEILVPEVVQPHPTVFEVATAAGLRPVVLGPGEHARSGLSRALVRAADHRPVSGARELVRIAAATLRERGRRFVYAYHGALDQIGHARGCAHPRWRRALTEADRMVAALSRRLPAGTLLVVTADHGMVDVGTDELVDVTDHHGLREGVRLLAGEPRCRHVHARPGAAGHVLAAWRELVGERMWVVSREQAIAAGWFGPRVVPAARRWIGDVVAVARTPVGIVDKRHDPSHREMTGHHGALTDAERLVPLVVVPPR